MRSHWSWFLTSDQQNRISSSFSRSERCANAPLRHRVPENKTNLPQAVCHHCGGVQINKSFLLVWFREDMINWITNHISVWQLNLKHLLILSLLLISYKTWLPNLIRGKETQIWATAFSVLLSVTDWKMEARQQLWCQGVWRAFSGAAVEWMEVYDLITGNIQNIYYSS